MHLSRGIIVVLNGDQGWNFFPSFASPYMFPTLAWSWADAQAQIHRGNNGGHMVTYFVLRHTHAPHGLVKDVLRVMCRWRSLWQFSTSLNLKNEARLHAILSGLCAPLIKRLKIPRLSDASTTLTIKLFFIYIKGWQDSIFQISFVSQTNTSSALVLLLR